MRQVEILAILKASDHPMTVAEIREAYGGHKNRIDSDQANIRKRLRTMMASGMVRQAGYVLADGHNRLTWEAVE